MATTCADLTRARRGQAVTPALPAQSARPLGQGVLDHALHTSLLTNAMPQGHAKRLFKPQTGNSRSHRPPPEPAKKTLKLAYVGSEPFFCDFFGCSFFALFLEPSFFAFFSRPGPNMAPKSRKIGQKSTKKSM